MVSELVNSYAQHRAALDLLAEAIQQLPPEQSIHLCKPLLQSIDSVEDFASTASLLLQAKQFDLEVTQRERDQFRKERDKFKQERDEYYDFIETEMNREDNEDQST